MSYINVLYYYSRKYGVTRQALPVDKIIPRSETLGHPLRGEVKEGRRSPLIVSIGNKMYWIKQIPPSMGGRGVGSGHKVILDYIMPTDTMLKDGVKIGGTD